MIYKNETKIALVGYLWTQTNAYYSYRQIKLTSSILSSVSFDNSPTQSWTRVCERLEIFSCSWVIIVAKEHMLLFKVLKKVIFWLLFSLPTVWKELLENEIFLNIEIFIRQNQKVSVKFRSFMSITCKKWNIMFRRY